MRVLGDGVMPPDARTRRNAAKPLRAWLRDDRDQMGVGTPVALARPPPVPAAWRLVWWRELVMIFAEVIGSQLTAITLTAGQLNRISQFKI